MEELEKNLSTYGYHLKGQTRFCDSKIERRNPGKVTRANELNR